MRIAVLSAEAVPYSKTGGLGDVAGALPKALKRIGEDSVLITPLYRQTKPEYLSHLAIDDLWVNWRGTSYRARVFYSEANGSPTFLIDAPEYFHRDSLYGYAEDYERFAFFNHAALVLIERIGAPPDIIHLNDWHCGFAAVEIASKRLWDDYWRNSRTVFSIHNLAYQGAFSAEELWKFGFSSEFARNAFLLNGHASAMKAGLAVSDILSTVSPRYSYEIQTPEEGYGLDGLLRQRSNRLIGITNGVDYDVWNPAADPVLPAQYNAQDLSGKLDCKKALLEQFSLPVDLEKPVFASITRLTSQKGIDLMMQTAGEILATGAYIVSLGSGAKEYEDFWQNLRDYAPRQVGVYRGYNEDLAHLIEAGADMFMMPSRFEPCGLNQMYSLRYGTIPIVRAVGGLDDTVENFDRVRNTGNGFKFSEYEADKFLEKIYEALFAYHESDAWRRLQRNGMTIDNSWENAARKYVKLYEMAKK
ncbi:MAG: glycogen/starch synthase, ADP-glucose type [Acidobacteria bacterium]|nr:glycogen/starch synthase, ADP-glucose type [Acidobacteriota bacterium]